MLNTSIFFQVEKTNSNSPLLDLTAIYRFVVQIKTKSFSFVLFSIVNLNQAVNRKKSHSSYITECFVVIQYNGINRCNLLKLIFDPLMKIIEHLSKKQSLQSLFEQNGLQILLPQTRHLIELHSLCFRFL